MKINLLTIMQNGAPLLPPMSAQDGYCLHFVDPVTGVLKGGFSLLCEAPQPLPSVLVQVECSEAVFAQMIDDPALDITWWEEVIDEEAAD